MSRTHDGHVQELGRGRRGGQQPLPHWTVRTHDGAGPAWGSGAEPRPATELRKSGAGGCGAGVHPYFTNGETEAGSRGGIPGRLVSPGATWRRLARCDSHRCGGAGGEARLGARRR